MAAAARTVTDVADRRSRDLARIHVLKKELALDDDAYRDLLQAVARVRSSADLDWSGRRTLIAHLERLKKAAGVRDGDSSAVKQQRLVRALWRRLGELGALRAGDGRDDQALAAFVKRQTGVAALAWLNSAQLRTLIENLKQWVARVEAATPGKGAA